MDVTHEAAQRWFVLLQPYNVVLLSTLDVLIKLVLYSSKDNITRAMSNCVI